MMDSFDSFVDSLIENPEPIVTKKSSNEQAFPCGQCAGTGVYHGTRIHQEKRHCFACRGKGYFKTDPRKLKENRTMRANKKADALKNAIESFQENNPAMFAELKSAYAIGEGNSFILSLAQQLFQRGTLSEKQIAAWHRGKEKLAEIKDQREKERAERAVTVDLAPIANMFATALQSGYKRPMYRANGLRIKPGKAGALYVLTEARTQYGPYGESPAYEGKIADGQFHPVRDTDADTASKLIAIANDPKGEAIRYGQKTGNCSCCGRELTKHSSIDAGIGPICAEKWGLN